MFVLLMPCNNLLYQMTLNGITVMAVLWAFFLNANKRPFAKIYVPFCQLKI